MNKTVVFVTFVALAAIGIIGATILSLANSPSIDKYVTFLVTILGLVSVAAGTFAALRDVKKTQDDQNTTLETVKRQTNGTLSSLLRDRDEKAIENARLRAELAALKGEQ